VLNRLGPRDGRKTTAETESFVTQLPPDCRGRPLATSWSHRMVAYDVTSSTGSHRQENLADAAAAKIGERKDSGRTVVKQTLSMDTDVSGS